MKLKIENYCLISREYPLETGFGGIGTYTWHMARALAKEGLDVTVLTMSLESPQDYQEDGIRVVRLFVKNNNLLLWYIAVAKFLVKNKFDVIEASEFWGSLFLYQLFFRKPGEFIHIRLHTCHKIVNFYEEKFSFFAKFKTSIIDFIELYTTKRANLVTSPSIFLKERTAILWGIPKDTIKLLPNPFHINTDTLKLEPITKKYVLYFGRLQKRKSADLLFKLIEEDFLRDSDLSFIMIGKDEFNFKSKLEKINNNTSKKVELIGHIKDAHTLFRYISSATTIFLPSKFDNFPLTLIEALWFNSNTYVLNNSGPMEIMTLMNMNEHILDESAVANEPEYLLSHLGKNSVILVESIREKIEQLFGYKSISVKLLNMVKKIDV